MLNSRAQQPGITDIRTSSKEDNNTPEAGLPPAKIMVRLKNQTPAGDSLFTLPYLAREGTTESKQGEPDITQLNHQALVVYWTHGPVHSVWRPTLSRPPPEPPPLYSGHTDRTTDAVRKLYHYPTESPDLGYVLEHLTYTTYNPIPQDLDTLPHFTRTHGLCGVVRCGLSPLPWLASCPPLSRPPRQTLRPPLPME